MENREIPPSVTLNQAYIKERTLRKCCIHCQPSASGDLVKEFTEETLKKCQTVSKARTYHKLQFSNFKIPNEVDSNYGYHSICYSKFTALKRHYIEKVPPVYFRLPDSVPGPSRKRREQRTQRSGVLKKMCIFCEKTRKFYNKKPCKLHLIETQPVQQQILEAANLRNDYNLLSLVGQGDFFALEAHYHKICLLKYLKPSKCSSMTVTQGSSWHKSRHLNGEAFQYISSVIEEDILINEKVYTLQELQKLFKAHIQSLDSTADIPQIRASYLEEKILKRFPSTLLVNKSKNEHIFFKSTMNLIPSLVERKLEEMKRNSLYRDAAFELRKEIKDMEKYPLPSTVSVADVLRGECKLPEGVVCFLKDFFYGPSTSRSNMSRNRRINSIASDMVFTSTDGRIRPSKQLMLGCAAKTITGSKKMVNVLNRLGHSVSYTAVEEVETELSYSSYESRSIIPHPIKKMPHLFTGVAFDNYDRFVETLTGKNTLHDTVGIIYQNADDKNESFPEQPNIDDTSPTLDQASETQVKARKRRKFEELIADVEPYTKTPKYIISLLDPQAERSTSTDNDYRIIDILWVLKCIFCQSQTPMWTGFNAIIFQDDSPTQTIGYLPQINSSPTSYAVVRHTMIVALQVADECGQDKIMCSYDLNIARMALEIQSADQPQFERLFIWLGSFHIELAFFKAMGKYVDGSGVVEILTESGLLASGSVSGFLGGTNYNRCKRVHRLLALALRRFHYNFFVATTDHENVNSTIERIVIAEKNQPQNDIDPKLRSHISEYLKFEERTAKGWHGLTAQYWMVYMHYIDLYNDFTRSIRMGNIDLYVKSLTEMNDIFFALNHQNYARWLVPFTDNIVKELREDNYMSKQLRKGLFGIKRTKKNFSRSPTDLSLEQTINADSANKLSGIVSTTNSISARQRWAFSHSQRTEIVSSLMDEVGLTVKEDSTKDLKPGRITHDHNHLEKMMITVEGMINPFKADLDPNFLFNICTGKPASDNVTSFLKGIPEKGKDCHRRFREACSQNPSHFYSPIKRHQILNFTADRPKIVINTVNKIRVLKAERNLFGRLLMISLKEKIDLKSVLKFPLTPVPLSLGHQDGTPVKTQKSVLLKHLEGLTTHDVPNNVDTYIIDGFYFLHILGNNLPTTYGGIATHILKKMINFKCTCVHLIFDRYVSPSIKDIERRFRGKDNIDSPHHISNPLQKRPIDFVKALRSSNYKVQLVNFLIAEWSKDEYATYFSQLALYVTQEEKCVYFFAIDTKVSKLEDPNLTSKHIESDSRMVYHLTKLVNSRVIVKTSDTDVLVIILGNLHLIHGHTRIWLEIGTRTKNDHRFIDVSAIHRQIGFEMSKALPALHSITGCDYTSAFYRIGKKKPFSIAERENSIKLTLGQFSDKYLLTDEEFSEIEKFVCLLYSRRRFSDIDELRLNMFLDAYSKMTSGEPLKLTKGKGIDSSNLPPCKKALYYHVLRAKYVTLMWTNLHMPNPPAVSPESYGWILDEGRYNYYWFDEPALPEKLEEIIIGEKSDDESDEDTSIESYDDSDSSNE